MLIRLARKSSSASWPNSAGSSRWAITIVLTNASRLVTISPPEKIEE
jgi:hypothetical protein